MCSMINRFKQWCYEQNMSSYPMVYDTIGKFLVEYVEKNKGSTKSIDLILGYFRRFCRLENLVFLSDTDSYKLELLVKHLKFNDTSGPNRKNALTLNYLLDILSKLNLSNNTDLIGITMMFLGHDGLLRSGEICSGLHVNDIEWSPDKRSFVLRLKRSKVNRMGTPEYITFVDRKGCWSAVKLLRMYFNKFNLWNAHGKVLFPKIRYKTISWSSSSQITWFRRYIKRVVSLIGLDPKQYSGHSLRAGGATDLFVAKVPYPFIKKFGRWKSDAALIL
jgi:hypothetical protein